MTGTDTTEFYTPEKDKLGLRTPAAMREGLPKVFVIGDSISCGYTNPVMELLQGVCNVRRAPDNCGDTRRGLQDLDKWVGGVRWDIIHFNWGLHDLCYRHPDSKVYGNRDKVRGTLSVPLDDYSRNLEELVRRLLVITPNLIWASTTYVPDGEAGRYRGDEVRYNEAAALLMAKYKVPINDLYSLTASFGPDMFTCPGDVHFSDKGYQVIAAQVANCVKGLIAELQSGR
jgi:hypothetical protein